jgi:hypothetical protein
VKRKKPSPERRVWAELNENVWQYIKIYNAKLLRMLQICLEK